jgi:hypothetical protein
MRPIVATDLHGRRLYLAGYRIHHGLVGLALVGFGAVLVLHDLADWPFPLIDRSA